MNSTLFAGQGNHVRIAPPQKKLPKSWKPCYMTGFQDHRLLTWMIFSPDIGITQLVINQPGFPPGQLMGRTSPASQTLECRRPRSPSMVQWPSARDRPRALQWKLEELSVSATWLGNRLWFLKGKIIEVNGRLSCLITREYQQFHI